MCKRDDGIVAHDLCSNLCCLRVPFFIVGGAIGLSDGLIYLRVAVPRQVVGAFACVVRCQEGHRVRCPGLVVAGANHGIIFTTQQRWFHGLIVTHHHVYLESGFAELISNNGGYLTKLRTFFPRR